METYVFGSGLKPPYISIPIDADKSIFAPEVSHLLASQPRTNVETIAAYAVIQSVKSSFALNIYGAGTIEIDMARFLSIA